MTLRDVDSNSDWREQEHTELQDLMQRRLHHLQVNNQCKFSLEFNLTAWEVLMCQILYFGCTMILAI